MHSSPIEVSFAAMLYCPENLAWLTACRFKGGICGSVGGRNALGAILTGGAELALAVTSAVGVFCSVWCWGFGCLEPRFPSLEELVLLERVSGL